MAMEKQNFKPEALAMADALNGERAPDAAPEEPRELTPELQRLEDKIDLAHKAEEIGRAMSADSFGFGLKIGQLQTFQAFYDLAGAGRLAMLRQLKDTKVYKKGVHIPQADGSILTIHTFEECCEAMGVSANQAYEDLKYLSVFGESFMESAKKAGISYRQLRQLRALPEDEQENLKELEDDPEALKDRVEEVIAEKVKLKKKLKDQEATLKARDDLIAEKNKKIDEAHTELAKLKSLTVDDQEQLANEKLQAAMQELIKEYGIFIGSGIKFFNTLNTALELPGTPPQIYEEMQGTANTAAGVLADMFANRLDWKIDFENLIYPEWITKYLENADSPPPKRIDSGN